MKSNPAIRFAMIMLIAAFALAPVNAALAAQGRRQENPFRIELSCVQDSSVTSGGCDSLLVSWLVSTDVSGLSLKSVQALNFAYDATLLKLVKSNGTALNTGAIGNEFSFAGATGIAGEYDCNTRLFAAFSPDRSVGFVQFEMGDPYQTCPLGQGSTLTLESVRFAFAEGKSFEDLNSDSIRLLCRDELELLNQSQGVLIATDENGNTQYCINSLRQEASGSEAQVHVGFVAKPKENVLHVLQPGPSGLDLVQTVQSKMLEKAVEAKRFLKALIADLVFSLLH